jgi:hypothetical protein
MTIKQYIQHNVRNKEKNPQHAIYSFWKEDYPFLFFLIATLQP